MTAAEFEQTCRDICPHCKAGAAIRFREDTGETVHDLFRGTAIAHGVCMATHYRNKYKDRLSE